MDMVRLGLGLFFLCGGVCLTTYAVTLLPPPGVGSIGESPSAAALYILGLMSLFAGWNFAVPTVVSLPETPLSIAVLGVNLASGISLTYVLHSYQQELTNFADSVNVRNAGG